MSESSQRVARARDALNDVLAFIEKDSEATVNKLMNVAGSPGALFDLDMAVYEDIGICEENALLLSGIPDIAREMHSGKHGKHVNIATMALAAKYLENRFVGLVKERLYVISLDITGKLIRCRLIESGSESRTEFNVKKALIEIMSSNAKYAIITHNHPSMTPEPSMADINCTIDIMKALSPIDIPLLDHIIMVGTDAVNLRSLGYIEESAWINQLERNDKILSGWLKDWSLTDTLKKYEKKKKINQSSPNGSANSTK